MAKKKEEEVKKRPKAGIENLQKGRSQPNKTTSSMYRYIPWDDPELAEPPRHDELKGWKESEAIAELEWVCRVIMSPDPSKLFFNAMAFHRGYRQGDFFGRLAKKMGGKCLVIYDMAKLMQNEKLSCLALNKFFDSRYGIYASMNLSKKSSDPWRQDAKVIMQGAISIQAPDYKGIKPDVKENVRKKLSGSD